MARLPSDGILRGRVPSCHRPHATARFADVVRLVPGHVLRTRVRTADRRARAARGGPGVTLDARGVTLYGVTLYVRGVTLFGVTLDRDERTWG